MQSAQKTPLCVKVRPSLEALLWSQELDPEPDTQPEECPFDDDRTARQEGPPEDVDSAGAEAAGEQDALMEEEAVVPGMALPQTQAPDVPGSDPGAHLSWIASSR